MSGHDEAIRTVIRVVRPGKCRACDGTGFMEDGPAGATYSAPCTFCRPDGIPRDAWEQAERIVDALAALNHTEAA